MNPIQTNLKAIAAWLTKKAHQEWGLPEQYHFEWDESECQCDRPSPLYVYDANSYRRWCGACGSRLRG